MKKQISGRAALRAGLILFVAALACGALLAMPPFLSGISLGLSAALIFVGILPQRAYQAVKAKKRALLRQAWK